MENKIGKSCRSSSLSNSGVLNILAMAGPDYSALKQIGAILNKNPKCKVVFLVGAGVSTACGIPDFRTPGTGLYDNLEKLNLPFAEAVFDIEYFEKNPQPFYALAKELYPGNFQPSKLHYLMRLFQDKGRLRRVYTQNIDTLERAAGLRDEFIIEAHGSFHANHCIKCDKQYSMDKFKTKILAEKPDDFAKCESCKGLIKPKIVFFGENLPSVFFDTWDGDLELLSKDHIVIVAGTSLSVYPFAALPTEVPKATPRALLNLQVAGDFKSNPRKSDMIFKGEAEEAAEVIVQELGWEDAFETLLEQEVKKEGKEVHAKYSEEIVEDVMDKVAELELSEK
ncbi:LAMI_0F12574g1_1 [Lachancea mirantina]|uniref:NAD-dependent protein deacetylase n=1 Tax=Lachancea mirantina TaxID=1230905 RepID=A0A1G4K2Y7_9SACH|nr:LAMI_0F12574g1_1 [Lachancea mirantina]